MRHFRDLYLFLQNYEENNIYSWLEIPWKGKDKQESLLRLFGSLGLIEKLKNYNICKGNYNLNTITIQSSIRDIFYDDNNNLINLKDKGDASDLTCISKYNEKDLLLTTSKNLNKTQVGKLDIDKILTNFEQYKINGYRMYLCVCIRNINDFNIMKEGIEKTNKYLLELLNNKNTIIIDWNDLNQSFNQFKLIFSNKNFNDIIKLNKYVLSLKMHQQLGVIKTLNIKNIKNKNEKILWGHIQRSGKSYIIAGCIINDSNNKNKCNYLIITTAPNETIEQQRKVLDCIQLEDFNIIVLNGKNIKPDIKDKNIIICSKQFLQNKIENKKDKTKTIEWLKNLEFDMRFIDESHNGGTTDLAQKTLDYYGKNSFTIQITATYSKPVNDYNISKEKWILWDLEDIKLCKNINNEENINRLIEKHGIIIKDIINKYSIENIINEYSKYPDLWILTDEIKEDNLQEIINLTKDNNYGWSTEGCFLLKQSINEDKIIIKDEFQNEKETLKLWYKIFGKKDKYDIPHKDYPDNIVFLKRIENICKNPLIDNRFIGEYDEPTIIMAFLPQNYIDEISKATIKLLEKNNVIPEYIIISINSQTTTNPKQSIEDARIMAKNNNKKGILVLSGRQCSLGVSIDYCDIVLLLNNNTSFDMIYQMMFRCMTEGKNKKCGFVVDLNIQRVIQTTIINYASLIKPEKHPKEATKYILQERLLNLNGDHWMSSFGNSNKKIDNLCKNIYEIFSSNTENALNQFLNRLKFKQLLLTKEEQTIFNVMFNHNTPTKQQKELINKILNEDNNDLNIKKGIEKNKIDNTDNNISNNDIINNDINIKEDKINYMDILKHIIPLICLLTIHNKETSFIEMFKFIENKKYIYNILLDQTKSWWGKNIDNVIIKRFINIYIKYMINDKETNQIIRTVKELFMKNINNSKELSQLIDKYLIPQELEKKANAEVSTPYKLRQEMLDKIPKEFWTKKRKVFEPCSGKGGFVIDIIDRFMDGLKNKYQDEKKRYKIIVEKCLYFSDINPTNIFVCKLLIDPYNKYKLNYNEGNTLDLDIKDKWDIEGFDAVIGNPPYNDNSSNKGAGHKIWDKFMLFSITKWLNLNGYLLYVHPPLWRQPKNKLYELVKKCNLMYLEIHNEKDGNCIFKCSTRYDWYLLQKSDYLNETIIIDENNKKNKINLNEWDFIPNGYFIDIKNLINSKDKHLIIADRSNYGADKKWVSKNKDDEYKYPVIYSLYKNGDVQYRYSNINNKGHFNIPKIIFTPNLGLNNIIDEKGEFGLTQWVVAICDNSNNLKQIKKIFSNNKFKNILKSIKFGMYYNTDIIKLFKKDFWKEFI